MKLNKMILRMVSCKLQTILLSIGLLVACNSLAQDSSRIRKDTTITDEIEAGESAMEKPKRRLVRWNEFDGRFMTLRLGAGILVDAADFIQDKESLEQVDMEPGVKIRDFRVLLKGKFKFKRSVTWSAGIMYDGANYKWLFRETGIMVAVPEISGHLFLGRTKEGFSLNKVMVGYAGWTMERMTMNDASIPILADGIKWLGYSPKLRLLWNVGVYMDAFSEGQSFSTYDYQFVSRVAWLPYLAHNQELIHIGVNARYGKVDKGQLRLRSRPENNIAPYFIDTEVFPSDHTTMGSLEFYYRKGPLLIGSEYFIQKASAPENGNPLFHGGDIVATWLFTGETRGFNTVGGFFTSISPKKTIFEGGPGAWEAVFRVSYTDLDSKKITGGKFLRFTPTINWYASDNIRLAFAYGYGILDRFSLTGNTHFFQSRLQVTF